MFRKTLSMDSTTEKITYEFLINEPEYQKADTMPIRVIAGTYAGLDFRFERITMSPAGDNLNINFDIEILKNPEGMTVSLSDQNLIDFLGEILYDILVNREDINANVLNNSEPIDLEADVHEEPNGKDHP